MAPIHSGWGAQAGTYKFILIKILIPWYLFFNFWNIVLNDLIVAPYTLNRFIVFIQRYYLTVTVKLALRPPADHALVIEADTPEPLEFRLLRVPLLLRTIFRFLLVDNVIIIIVCYSSFINTAILIKSLYQTLRSSFVDLACISIP